LKFFIRKFKNRTTQKSKQK